VPSRRCGRGGRRPIRERGWTCGSAHLGQDPADLTAGLPGNEVDDLQALVEGFGEPIHQASVQLAEDLGVLFGDGGDGAVVEAVFGSVAFCLRVGWKQRWRISSWTSSAGLGVPVAGCSCSACWRPMRAPTWWGVSPVPRAWARAEARRSIRPVVPQLPAAWGSRR